MQLNTSKLTIGEVELIQVQYDGSIGSFKRSLWKAIMGADSNNLDRLAKAYPEQISAYRRYTGEDGYWVDVLTRAGLVASPEPQEPPIPSPETPPMPQAPRETH